MKTFKELDLLEPLQRALEEEGYLQPTPIQAQTIPPALDGFDILGCAQTGTGKTAAFALPILDEQGYEPRRPVSGRPYVLILAPTRELAIQIGESIDTYGRHLKLRSTVIFGGVSQHRQVQALKNGVHILIATPGRLLDLMNQGHVHLDRLETFVLDEADRMMDMGFLPDLKRIIRHLPEDRQSLFFSATLPPKIVELAESMLYKPVRVDVAPKMISVDNIKQSILVLPKNQRQQRLHEILAADDVYRAIVFTRTKRGANVVERKLKAAGFEAAAIHGNKSQGARQRALGAFRDGKVQVLVATDVAARGIDVESVTHVVNFDLPDEPASYVHRIGRTGRAGAEGVAVSFCLPEQREELAAIEAFIDEKLVGVDESGFCDPSDVPKAKPTGRRGGSGRSRGGKRRSKKPAAASNSGAGNRSAKKKPRALHRV